MSESARAHTRAREKERERERGGVGEESTIISVSVYTTAAFFSLLKPFSFLTCPQVNMWIRLTFCLCFFLFWGHTKIKVYY